MNDFQCPKCNHQLPYADEHAGKNAECPKCGQRVRLPEVSRSPGAVVPQAPSPSRAAVPPLSSGGTLPVFPALGSWIGWSAVVLGCLMIAGGIMIVAVVLVGDGDFKPGGLIVFVFPGILWVVCGGLLLRLRQRFVTPFWGFLMFNLLLGVFFTTQARTLGGRSETQIFAMIGLGFIVAYLVFQLFLGLLVRDVRRQAAAGR